MFGAGRGAGEEVGEADDEEGDEEGGAEEGGGEAGARVQVGGHRSGGKGWRREEVEVGEEVVEG